MVWLARSFTKECNGCKVNTDNYGLALLPYKLDYIFVYNKRKARERGSALAALSS